VLGQTRPGAAENDPHHIQVWFDQVSSVLASEATDRPLLKDYIAARALGRVLAHEVGHVLLGAQHDASGLMQPIFASTDLAGWDRARFRLAASGIDRFRWRARVLAASR
jgi:hypothetical protein